MIFDPCQGVLIIGPSNYPCSLTLNPLVGSLAAGNPAILKPSELCPNTARLLSRLIRMYFAPEDGVVQVIEGDGADTAELCKAEWGMIFFTGSQRIGKVRGR
jgi:acyl-CoA reductase-like NAD-dependent aldehyde dehydrogenase